LRTSALLVSLQSGLGKENVESVEDAREEEEEAEHEGEPDVEVPRESSAPWAFEPDSNGGE